MAYVKTDKELSRDPARCIFCKHLKNKQILVEFEHFFLVHNEYPYMEQHTMLLPKRHIHSELDFNEDECAELVGVERRIIEGYYKIFGSCFTLTRENTRGQTQWHWHRHYMPHEETVIPEAPRVPLEQIKPELLEYWRVV